MNLKHENWASIQLLTLTVLTFCLLCQDVKLFLPKKYIYKHSINPKYIKQWIIYFKIYIWLGTFRYNCTRGQLNNKGGGELHKIKQSWDKTEKVTNNIKSKQIYFGVTCAWDCFTTWKVICVMYLYWNVFQ